MTSLKAPGSSETPPDLEIAGDQITVHPSGYTESSSKHDGPQERNLVEHMARFRQRPFDFLRDIGLFISGTGWRAYDDIIGGTPIFYSGYTENIKTAVMASSILNEKITDMAEKRLLVEEKEGTLDKDSRDFARHRAKRKNEIVTGLQEVVEVMIDQMICKMESKRFIRGAYYLCTQLLTRAYHQGRVSCWRGLQSLNCAHGV
jgi:hypothetical protein